MNTVDSERKATDHTAVLLPGHRNDTGLRSGRMAPAAALRLAAHQGVIWVGMTCKGTMQLGKETPFYEVAYKGKVYRVLTRPVLGQDSSLRDYDVKYELVRTWAPGLQVDGWFMESPEEVPKEALIN